MNPTRLHRFESVEHPGFVFQFSPLGTAVWNFCVDRSWRQEAGVPVQDIRLFFGWVLRFATDSVEGLVWHESPPEPFEHLHVMTRSYRLMSQEWFDRLPPTLVIETGREIVRLNTLTEDEKKRSESEASASTPETAALAR